MSGSRTRSMIVPAKRTADIRYAVRDVLLVADEARRAGRSMLYLNVGDPNIFGFRPPDAVIEATIAAMRANHNGYAPSSGTPEAIAAISREATRKGIRDINHVFVTSGASEAIDLAISALADPGDNILTPSPGYPLYTAILARLGIENRAYFLDESNGWQPDVADLAARIDARTRGIVLVNPNNPTGSVATRETLRALVDLALDRDVVILSDEIYDKLVFDGGESISTAALSSEAKIITFNGLSKSYVVPGFRIGWGIVSGPESAMSVYCEAIRKMERARLSANHPEQFAIAPALDGDQKHLGPMLERLRRQRDATVEGFNAIEGISCVPPRGAFYAFPRIELAIDDESFCKRVIRETGVVIVPGSGFGQRPGTQHFRVVFLPEVDQLHDAFRRIASVVDGVRPARRQTSGVR